MILYVEDELVGNIPRILMLFGNLLGKKIRRQLEQLESDDYAPSPQEIKELVDRSNLVHVEYTFTGALNEVVHHHDRYKLFIVDRNLSKERICELEEIQKIDPSFNVERHNEYFDREGDYLLQYLVHHTKMDCLAFFYFLTAYPVSDVLRVSADIKRLIDFKRFSAENFIEKGNEHQYGQLAAKIDSSEEFKIKNDNRLLFESIGYLGQADAVQLLLDIIRNTETSNPKVMRETLVNIRNAEERILTFLRVRLNMPEKFKSKWEREKETYSNGKTNRDGVVSYLSENGFFSDSDAKSANTLWALCSQFGSHAGGEEIFVKDAFFASVSLLHLLLLRFGAIMKNL